jgi:hypothetical protein
MISLEYPFLNNQPQVPIIIKSPLTRTSIQVFALIDTGADNCLFPNYVPSRLGHVLKDHGAPAGISYGVEEKGVMTWSHPRVIGLADPKDYNLVAMNMRQRMIECIDSDTTPVLLGTSNFLRYFKLTVAYKEKIVRLDLNSP